MKKLLVLFVLFGTHLGSWAQDDTYNFTTRKAQLSNDTMQVNVMVIPTDPRLYVSFYDKQMTKANELTYPQLRDSILTSLAYMVAQNISDSLSAGVVPESNSAYRQDMAFVYDNITYSHDVIPEPEENQNPLDKLKNPFKKKTKTEKKKGTYMDNGQIVSNPDHRPKYTNAHITNDDFLFLLNSKYGSEYFVFINQVEITYATNTSQIDIQGDNYPREIRVHFTITNQKGKEVTSGIVIRNASSLHNNLQKE